MEPIKPITLSNAIKIVKDIYNIEYGVIEKKKAIRAVAATKFTNSITKEQLIDVIRWQAGMQKEEKKDGDS